MPPPLATPTPTHDRAACGPRSLRRTLAWFGVGRLDPTTWSAPGRFVRAALTPDGPGTLALRWADDHGAVTAAEAWGPGGAWLLARVERLTGADDEVPEAPTAHPVVARAWSQHRDLRLGASDDLYHALLPTVIAQRITGGEAAQQWRRLCLALGEPAPGPFARLTLPPAPATLHRRPGWWFHPLGIERSRARTLVEVARVADRLWDWADLSPHECGRRLALLGGVGPWTVGSVLGPALGDPDAVAVGDFHLKHLVSWALASEPRGTDERMLQLLEPFEGQRGRVIRLLSMSGRRAPAYGPRQRVLPMHRW